MHPDLETLMGLRDGELLPERQVEIREHLSACPSCREQLMHIQAAVDSNGPADDSLPGFLELEAQIGRLEAGLQRPELSGEGLRSRMTDHLKSVLGKVASRRVLQPVGPDNRDLFATVEPVLAEFLGPQAAGALIDRFAQDISAASHRP